MEDCPIGGCRKLCGWSSQWGLGTSCGVGVCGGLAYECADEVDLVGMSAEGLFPRCTTWLGFRRDSVLRGYMVDFISLFAPHLTPELTRQVADLETQVEVDALLADIPLPVRGGVR